MSKVMSSFCVAAPSWPADAGVAAVHCHERAIHDHVCVEWIPRKYQAHHHQWLSYAPSSINNFASLGNHLGEIKCRNWNEANSSKETVKTRLFCFNSVPEMNTKNMDNSPSFLSVTHTILSAKRFRCYWISKIDFAADFCFWTEQRLILTQLLGLGLAETQKVPNTIMVGKSLIFPMVYNMASNG
jgi:hypothetical protein